MKQYFGVPQLIVLWWHSMRYNGGTNNTFRILLVMSQHGASPEFWQCEWKAHIYIFPFMPQIRHQPMNKLQAQQILLVGELVNKKDNKISLVCDQAWFYKWLANKDNYYPLEKTKWWNWDSSDSVFPLWCGGGVCPVAPGGLCFWTLSFCGQLGLRRHGFGFGIEHLNFDWHLASGAVFPIHLVNKSLFACKRSSMSFSKVLNFLISCTSHPCADNMVWIPANPKMLLLLKLDGVIKIMPCYQLENMTGYSSEVVISWFSL